MNYDTKLKITNTIKKTINNKHFQCNFLIVLFVFFMYFYYISDNFVSLLIALICLIILNTRFNAFEINW